MNDFDKPPPFEFKCNRQVILSHLADMQICGANEVEKTYCLLILAEILDKISFEIPELGNAAKEILSKLEGENYDVHRN